MNYGEKITALRKKKGMTQAELGAELNVTYQAVSKWERGESQPDFGTMSKIAHLFDVPLSYFEEGDEQTAETVATAEAEVVMEETEEVKEAEKKLLGVCHDCGKALYEGDAAKTDPFLLCSTCNQKRIREANLKKQEEERKRKQAEQDYQRARQEDINYRNRGLIWSAVITGVLLIAGIVSAVQIKDAGAMWATLGSTVLGGVFVYFWITQLIWGGAVRTCACGGSSIIGTPGVIFELDLDGVIFLIAVKILFAVLRLLIWIATSLICVLASILIAPFTFVPALIRVNSGDIY